MRVLVTQTFSGEGTRSKGAHRIKPTLTSKVPPPNEGGGGGQEPPTSEKARSQCYVWLYVHTHLTMTLDMQQGIHTCIGCAGLRIRTIAPLVLADFHRRQTAHWGIRRADVALKQSDHSIFRNTRNMCIQHTRIHTYIALSHETQMIHLSK